jgi:hypothetical protein
MTMSHRTAARVMALEATSAVTKRRNLKPYWLWLMATPVNLVTTSDGISQRKAIRAALESSRTTRGAHRRTVARERRRERVKAFLRTCSDCPGRLPSSSMTPSLKPKFAIPPAIPIKAKAAE